MGDCLHEVRQECTPDPQPSLYQPQNYPTGHLAHCMGCNVLLYRMDWETGELTLIDETYERLYTRKGRTKYLIELMLEKGDEIPGVWKL